MENSQKQKSYEYRRWRQRLRPWHDVAGSESQLSIVNKLRSTTDVFRFMDLPTESRNQVYMFAAETCSHLAPLRLRGQRGCTMGVLLTPGSCECAVHEPLKKLSLYKPNGHTLHNLMRLSHAIYDEAEAAMHRFVPILVCLQSFTGRVKWVYPELPQPLPFNLKETSTIIKSLKHTRCIVLQCGLAQLESNAADAHEARIHEFFDWWVANSTPQALLRVRLWEFATHPICFDALWVFDDWLSNRVRSVENIHFVFDGMEECEDVIRDCDVHHVYTGPGEKMRRRWIEGGNNGRGFSRVTPLSDWQISNIRWFCRRHPALIESGTDWANVEDQEEDEHGDVKVEHIYPDGWDTWDDESDDGLDEVDLDDGGPDDLTI